MLDIFVFLTAALTGVVKAEQELTDHSEIDVTLATVIVCASVIVLILVLSLCGGCTPMEVGSDDHAAACGRKTNNTQYSSISTDVNTHVMTSGTTFADDPYQPSSQALPYNPHPQTAHTFTGYNAPTAPVGMTPAQQHGYQQPGANRHFSESEPPPPNYSEAISSSHGQVQGHHGATAPPAQPYGW